MFASWKSVSGWGRCTRRESRLILCASTTPRLSTRSCWVAPYSRRPKAVFGIFAGTFFFVFHFFRFILVFLLSVNVSNRAGWLFEARNGAFLKKGLRVFRTSFGVKPWFCGGFSLANDVAHTRVPTPQLIYGFVIHQYSVCSAGQIPFLATAHSKFAAFQSFSVINESFNFCDEACLAEPAFHGALTKVQDFCHTHRAGMVHCLM